MSNTKTGGMRFNSNKLRFNLIPMDARVELARVFTIGAMKYDDNNWLKGMSWMSMVDCADRHFALWQMGQARDPDTGCHHLAQVAWNVLGLLVYELRGLGVDDRTKLPIDELFNWIEGPAAELNLGLPPEELEALRSKYAKLREEHKAKMEAEAKKSEMVEAVDEALEKIKVAKESESEDLYVALFGYLENLGGQDTEGYPVYGIRIGATHFTPRHGDVLTVWDSANHQDGRGVEPLFDGPIKGRWKSGNLPQFIQASWFDKGYGARLVRKVEFFSEWHIEYSLSLEGLNYNNLEGREMENALQAYAKDAIKLSHELNLPIDINQANRIFKAHGLKFSFIDADAS